MKFENIYDFHTHSEYSFDGNNSCVLMCEKTEEKNLKGICITDHCDIDSKTDDFDKLFMSQTVDIAKCKCSFEGQIDVFGGIEIGQAIYRKEKTIDLLNKFNFDFVLGSLHNLENVEDFYFLDYNKENIDDLLNRYFDDLIELCEFGNFDSLAHILYPFRYIEGKYNKIINISLYIDKIKEIFNLLIINEKSLEINTSGLFNEYNKMIPNSNLLNIYHNMGGKLITIGSDSHFCDKVGQGLDQALEMLNQCGYNQYTIYKNRQPIMVDIK